MLRLSNLLKEHQLLTRRNLLKVGGAGAMIGLGHSPAEGDDTNALTAAIGELEPYLTDQNDFRDVSRGKPLPHRLPMETKRQVGMTRDSWQLEVLSDPDHPVDLRNALTRERGNAFDFTALMELAKSKAVRFAKVMTCLNIGRPLGMGIWEGVPLRELFWHAQPRKDVRRVFFYGYHNDKPEQMFRSSLPVNRILEDLHGTPPVILCYKLNGEWLTSERGGPVRIVVPEAYGFKSIKWLSHIVLTNLFHANDTYAEGNNDIDSALKTFSATLSVPKQIKSHQPIPITGYAQVGIAGVARVQVWVHRDDERLPKDDKNFQQAPWKDATILPPPENLGGGMQPTKLQPIMGFDETSGRPTSWPLRYTRIHWAMLLDGLPRGKYTLRSRTIDENGNPQPLPRPFQKSGHAAIERVPLVVEP